MDHRDNKKKKMPEIDDIGGVKNRKSDKKIKEITSDDADFATIEDEVGHKYQITSQIGAGSYGNVYEAIERKTQKKVAIKSIHSIFDDLVDWKRIMREIKLLRHMNWPYVIKLYDVIPPDNRKSFNRLNIVLEYADSDLKKLLKSSLSLDEIHVKTIMYNVLWAMKYMHSAGVLHRDIKPGNILVNEDWSIKLWDFGLARSISGVVTGIDLVNKIVKDIEYGKDSDKYEEYKDYVESRKATIDEYVDFDK